MEASWFCGARECPTHERPEHRCPHGTWRCGRARPECAWHARANDRCATAVMWDCGESDCRLHARPEDRCATGTWYCGRMNPPCPGHHHSGICGTGAATVYDYLCRQGPAFGNNGFIPTQYLPAIRNAIEIAWRLAYDRRFTDVFRKTVALFANAVPRFAYSLALNKMVIHDADSTRSRLVLEQIREEDQAVGQHPLLRPAPAVSFYGQRHMWIRRFRLERQRPRELAADIIHEGAHLVGIPALDPVEIPMEAIHSAAKLPR